MARQVKVLESYAAEATRLQRLARSVQADKRRPEGWRNRASALLNEIAIVFLEDEQKRIRGECLESPATMAISREEKNRRRRVARALKKARELEEKKGKNGERERKRELAQKRKARREAEKARDRMAAMTAAFAAMREYYEEQKRIAAGKPPKKKRKKAPPKQARKPKIESEIDIGLSVATAELRSRHPDIPASYSMVVNGDDSIDGEIVGHFRDPMPDETSQWLLTAELALAMPPSVWVSVAFVMFFPPKMLPSEKTGKKKTSPGWRKSREGDLVGAEYTRKLYWQRWSEKGLHFHGARRTIEAMIKETPAIMVRRIKVRVYWSPDGQRPSKSRLR